MRPRLIGLLSFALCLSASDAQRPLQPAPIPKQISEAKRVFLSNEMDADSKAVALDYNLFHDGLKQWGRYALTETPAEADLIFVVRTSPYVSSGAASVIQRDRITLRIIDQRSGVTLWSITKGEPDRFMKGQTSLAADQVAAIIDAVKKLSQPGAVAEP